MEMCSNNNLVVIAVTRMHQTVRLSEAQEAAEFSDNRFYCFHSNAFCYTALFEMIFGVLTTCHTQYTRDRSVSIFLFNPLNTELNPICQ